MKDLIKGILGLFVMIVLSVSMSACTFFYKEKVVKPREEKISIETTDIKTEEQLNEKIEEIITKKEEVNESNYTQEAADNSNEETEITERKIIEKYKSEFSAIQGEYNGKINSMISQAKGEYDSLPKEKKTTMMKIKLGLKYVDKVKILEGECDKKVYSKLDAMEDELSKNGYGTESVSVVKNYYENAKTSRKSYYMSKLK